MQSVYEHKSLHCEEVPPHVSEYCGHIVQVVHQLRGGGGEGTCE